MASHGTDEPYHPIAWGDLLRILKRFASTDDVDIPLLKVNLDVDRENLFTMPRSSMPRVRQPLQVWANIESDMITLIDVVAGAMRRKSLNFSRTPIPIATRIVETLGPELSKLGIGATCANGYRDMVYDRQATPKTESYYIGNVTECGHEPEPEAGDWKMTHVTEALEKMDCVG